MDFYKIKTIPTKSGSYSVYPDFVVTRSNDLMVRGRSFYAVWDEAHRLWSLDEYDIQRLVDTDIRKVVDKLKADEPYAEVSPKYMSDFKSQSWTLFQRYLSNISDNYKVLDTQLTFADTIPKKTDYVSKKLPYSLGTGTHRAWDELMSTIYSENDRAKLEWAIGGIVAGEAKDIQKFLVIYGEAGGGKSTILNIIQKLFDGYYTTFEARALTGYNNTFSTEVFKNNPLVAIQHDGDLSKIKDNTKLNSMVSHEYMTMNEKYKSSYTARSNAFLFMGTNTPVKISSSKSGLIRRLINVNTSGKRVPTLRYNVLLSQIDFELGDIAQYCLDIFYTMGKRYYDSYRPLEMILETDFFFNFIEEFYFIFKDTPQITLNRGYDLYKEYCTETGYEYPLPKHRFRAEFGNYFSEFKTHDRINGKLTRSVYSQFRKEKFESQTGNDDPVRIVPVLESDTSIFDEMYPDAPAQYATTTGIPQNKWATVSTTLSDLDSSKLHYVKPPLNHIVIDFDLKDELGEKSEQLNLEAAAKWPQTYTEYSKSRRGVHLHYLFDGPVEDLSRVYDHGIEVKVFVGDASLRRSLSKCNDIPVTTISSGLQFKEVRKVLDFTAVQSVKGLRRLVERNLNKEIHPGTKPSIDFIHRILEDAYDGDLSYDLTEMRPKILTFATRSTNQSEYCVSLVGKMKFKSEDPEPKDQEEGVDPNSYVFFDVEVFPNLFLVSWKLPGEENKPVRMINPTPQEIEELISLPLIGFNNRRYDNHILYARYLGYTNAEIYNLSSKIIGGSRNAMFREAYGLSYADIYDFTTKKQSLKAYEIELGITHNELDLPWNEPAPEELWEIISEYCDDDVIATELTFYSRKQDFIARQILSDISGLPVNSTTQAHTARILFAGDKYAKDSFEYTNLSEEFPEYLFDLGKSSYRGENPGEGGYVYSEPGMYENVVLLDIASMHPTSIEILNLFGKYTERYSAIKQARLAIKHKRFDEAGEMFDGKLKRYLGSEEGSDALSFALKIVINIVYGLTSAKFDNPFKDNRNKDNIVAKRGSLFMIDLKHAVQDQGYIVAHIKTDSIKIPNADQKIIDFVFDFGKKYGYDFEHEATYEKLCLVNNAVYVAKEEGGGWVAVGAEFSHPVVFKSLFSKELITFEDQCETKAVTHPAKIYIDLNENLEDVSAYEQEVVKRDRLKENPEKRIKLNPEMTALSWAELSILIAAGHNYQFVGKTGSFYPIKSGAGGGVLYRVKEGSYYAVSGTKGFRWLERDMVRTLNKEDDINKLYHKTVVDNAVDHLSEFGDVGWFLT